MGRITQAFIVSVLALSLGAVLEANTPNPEAVEGEALAEVPSARASLPVASLLGFRPRITALELLQLPNPEDPQATACFEGFAFFATRHEPIGDDYLHNDGVFELKLAGSDIEVRGRAHGNLDVQMSGSTTLFTDLISAHGTLEVNGSTNTFANALGTHVSLSGSSNTFTGIGYTTTFGDVGSSNIYPAPITPVPSPPLLPPRTFDIADYAPGGSSMVAAGADYHTASGLKVFTTTELNLGGLWYITGDAELPSAGSSSAGGPGITIVTTGTITVNGSFQRLRSFTDDLLFFANKTDTSSSAVLETSGSGISLVEMNTYDGIIYAPNGLASLGGQNATYTTIVIADRLELSGSDLVFQFGAGLCIPDLTIDKTVTDVDGAGPRPERSTQPTTSSVIRSPCRTRVRRPPS